MKLNTIKGPPRRLLSVLLACLLVLALLPAGALAASGDHITVTIPEQIEGLTGSLYRVTLSEVFQDEEGHSLDYSFSCDQDLTDHTKIKDGVFHFSVDRAGDYDVTLQASCGTDTATCTVHFDIAPPADGLSIQYNYTQTNQSSVQVFVTISSDGIPIVGKDEDNTILCHVPITVPYFDLSEYGLEDFYRYRNDESGSYNGTTVIERPTALHLYLYLLERFALGYPEEECGKGLHNPIEDSFDPGTMIETMFGSEAYEAKLLPLYITGSATSMYMQNFWGHDENLMYYRNHVYPLMSPGWGSTADYILLSDGDTIDLAMFTNWNFYNYGAFMCFGDDGSACNTYHLPSTQDAGEDGVSLTTTLLKFGTQAVSDGGVDFFLPEELEGNEILIFKEENGVLDAESFDACYTEEDGRFTATFTEDGRYQLVFLDPGAGTEDACLAPATAYVIVGDCDHTESCTYTPAEAGQHTKVTSYYCPIALETVDRVLSTEDCSDADTNGICDFCGAVLEVIIPGDVTGDGAINAVDAGIIRQYASGKNVILSPAAADVNGDGVINVVDAGIIQQYAAGKITSFPTRQ